MYSNKVWYYFCLCFLIYNLILLWEDGYELSHRSLENNEMDVDPFNFSICLPILELLEITGKSRKFALKSKINSTILILSSIDKASEKFRSFYKNFQKRDNNYKNMSLDQFIRKDSSYIFKRHICFILNNDPQHFNKIYAFYDFEFKLLLVSELSKSFFFNSVYWNMNSYLYIHEIKILKLIIKRHANPFSNCVKQVTYSKFNCINECLKEKSNKFIYYYHLKSNELIDLEDTNQDRDQEGVCYNRCRKESCSLEYMFAANDIRSFKEKNILNIQIEKNNPKISSEYINLDVYPTTSKFDFWMQFIGLICLFFNLSINENLPAILKLIILKCSFKRPVRSVNSRFLNSFSNSFSNRIYPKIKIFLLVMSICLMIKIWIFMNNEFHQNEAHPLKSINSQYSTEIISLALYICIPVQYILNKSKTLTNDADDFIINKFTFKQIEMRTVKGLEDLQLLVYLKYNSDEHKINFKATEKVFFRHSLFLEKRIGLFSRCWQINIDLKEERFRSVFANTKLAIDQAGDGFMNVYVNDLNKKFTSDAFHSQSKFEINKIKLRRSENSKDFNCTNYSLRNNSEYDCDSQTACLNTCIARNHLKQHFKFLIGKSTIIAKSDYSDYLFENTYFTMQRDKNISKRCEELFRLPDCRRDYYAESYKESLKKDYRIIINLFFEHLIERDTRPSREKFWFSVLNLESILFGSNLQKVLITLIAFIKITFKLKSYHWFKHLVFLICFLAFLCHMYFIFISIINGALNENGYFKKVNKFVFPDLVFCYEFNESAIDSNHALTGEYLDELTKEFTFETVFQKILYFNKNDESIEVQNFTNGFNNDLSYSDYYLYNMKCFEIKLNMAYSEKEFLFIEDPYAFKLWFNSTVVQRYFKNSRSLIIYFTCKKRNTKQFNIFSELVFRGGRNYKKYKYQVKFELSHMQIEELNIFQYIKNPLSLILGSQKINNRTNYLNSMQDKFKQNYNKTTKMIILDKNFRHEIDDSLFNQYFLQVAKHSNLLKLIN